MFYSLNVRVDFKRQIQILTSKVDSHAESFYFAMYIILDISV